MLLREDQYNLQTKIWESKWPYEYRVDRSVWGLWRKSSPAIHLPHCSHFSYNFSLILKHYSNANDVCWGAHLKSFSAARVVGTQSPKRSWSNGKGKQVTENEKPT